MLKVLKILFQIAVASAALIAHPSMATEKVSGNLISIEGLKSSLGQRDMLLFDASPAPMYAAQHIPGAINVDAMTLLTFGIRQLPVAQVEKTYQLLGLSPGKKIVIYDQGGTWFAARLFFDLVYYGFPAKDIRILDGGLFKWKKDGLTVTKDIASAPMAGKFRIKKLNEDVRVRLPEFLAASGDTTNNVLLEALGPDGHFGATSFFDKPGHIPNAVLLPSEDFFNADKTFKSPDEIRKMLAQLSIRPDQQIHSHCGGGGAASVPFFALKYVMNYPNVKLYTESQMGWLSDERDLPFWTFDAPYLMREMKWLQTWGGQMMRMYGISNVSVVDVRSPDAYKQGHVPFALNIPGDTFRSNIGSPGKLAETLGPAGVNASHEAVIVSGGGLTKDAALAFVMLEKLGQKKVSIFMDAMDSIEAVDKFAQRGFALTKKEPVVGASKKPGDLSIPIAPYANNVRKEVVIADAKNTEGIYPKVFIASGNALPAKAQDGKVVHVPYTSLLNADGTPKAAKEIWNILSKAGVSRYAELVTVSDDPGEAAANYFILKLMGFPDIKMLAG